MKKAGTATTISNNKFNKYEVIKFREVTAAIINNIGFNTANSSAISSLSFLLRTYFEQLCRDSLNSAVQAGRNEVSLEDASRVFNQNGINLSELHDYMHQVAPFPSPNEVPIFPVIKPIASTSNETANGSDRNEEENRGVLVSSGSGIETSEIEDDNKKDQQDNKGAPTTSSSRLAARSTVSQKTFPNFVGAFASDLGFTVRKIEPPVENMFVEQQLSKKSSFSNATFTVFKLDHSVAQPLTTKAVAHEDRILKKKKKKEKREKERSEKDGKRKKHKKKTAEEGENRATTSSTQHDEQQSFTPSPEPLKIPKLKIRFGLSSQEGQSPVPSISDEQISNTPLISDQSRMSTTPEKVALSSPPKEEHIVTEKIVPPLKIGLKPMANSNKEKIYLEIEHEQQIVTTDARKSNSVDDIAESLKQKQKEISSCDPVVPIPQIPTHQQQIPQFSKMEETEKTKIRKRKAPPIKGETLPQEATKASSKPPTPKPLSKPPTPAPTPPYKLPNSPPPSQVCRPPSVSIARENLLEEQRPIPSTPALKPSVPFAMTSSGRSVKPTNKSKDQKEIVKSVNRVQQKPKSVPSTSKTPKLSFIGRNDSAAKVQAIAKAVEKIAAAQNPALPPNNFVIDEGQQQQPEDDEPIWICPACSVAYVEGQEMVACDQCDRWFHWSCVGILLPPPENAQWYCTECKKKRKKSQQSGGGGSGSSSRKSSLTLPPSTKKRRPSKT